MAPAAADFVRQVMAALGCDSAAQLAEAMGWPRGAERNVGKWLKGDNQPNYERTIEMLERCGWLALTDESRAAEQPARREGRPRPRQEELLAEVALGVSVIVEHFELRDELAQRGAGKAQTQDRKKRQGRAR